MKWFKRLLTHGLALLLGFGLGIYALPILTAPPAPTDAELAAAMSAPRYVGTFERDLEDSDALHWGHGTVSLGEEAITFDGNISPGPDFRLYLSPEWVETEDAFERLKPRMREVGDVKTFENFIVRLDPDVNLADYNTVIVWCESLGQFITAAPYRPVGE